MFKQSAFFFALAALLLPSSVSAYEFWGVTVGAADYAGSPQLTFDGLENSGIQYVVGGYEYTRVDSQWYGPFPAAAPGEGYLASRRSDAQGLFFRPDVDAARFVIITGAAQAGAPAPECGTETRLFGPGDLKIDIGENTFGVGLRIDGLLWALDPDTTNPDHQIHRAEGGIDSIYARDAGTVGAIELNPQWDRAGHSTLADGSDMAYAFFTSGSGSTVGSALVDHQDTGIVLCGASVYAYEVAVPWSAVGLDPQDFAFRASWRPDCGNDLLTADLAGSVESIGVPEPSVSAGVLGGLLSLAVIRRRGRTVSSP